jgi:hypothetical protein
MAIAHILILFIIGTIPILFAAVQPWVWSVYSCCMIAAFLVFLWRDRIRISIVPALSVKLTVVLFFMVTLFLSLPLPGYIISYLSPVRFQTLSETQLLLNTAFNWQTLSYSPLVALSWWVFLLSLCLFFVTVRNLCADAKILKCMVLVMMGVALLEAVYGLIQALVPTMGVLWVDYVQAYMGSARGTFINRNHFAGFIEMTWPLALGFIPGWDCRRFNWLFDLYLAGSLRAQRHVSTHLADAGRNCWDVGRL